MKIKITVTECRATERLRAFSRREGKNWLIEEGQSFEVEFYGFEDFQFAASDEETRLRNWMNDKDQMDREIDALIEFLGKKR